VLLFVALVRPAVPAAESPIATAAKAGDRAAVRRLIAARADVNATERDGSTALLWATYNSDIELVRALLAAGAKPDAANRFGVTPLLQASSTGDMPIIEALLKAGANAELAHPEGQTPLMAAARAGRVDAVKLLLAKGAKVNAADQFASETALMWAAGEGHLDVVETLLEAGANANVKAKVNGLTDRKHGDFPTGGFTPLMWAVRNGNEDVVKALVKKGADLKATNGDNLTATVIAINNDRLDMAAMLLDMGSDPNDGSLYFAVDLHDGTTDMRQRDGGLLRWDHPNKLTTLDLIKKLLDMGADPNKPFNGVLHSWGLGAGENHNGTPFYRAAVASDVEAMKVLLAKKADMSWIPPAGGRGGAPRPALIAASTGGRGYNFGGGPGFGRIGPPTWREPGSRSPIDAVKLMLQAGADPNVQLDDDGNTALHQAAQRNDLDMIRALVAGKANLEAYNWTGQTPLNIAEDNAEKAKDKNAAPDPAVIAAMVAGTALPESKATPDQTVDLLRELLGWPALPKAPAQAKPTNTTASAQGN
jgi:ankyrin repeat protein